MSDYMDGTLRTEAEGMEFTALVFERDANALAEWMDARELNPGFMVSLTANLCANLLPLVTGETMEPGDMWILQQGPGAFGQVPPAYQLVTTRANDDEATYRALMQTVADDPELCGDTLVELIGMYADLLHILANRKQAAS